MAGNLSGRLTTGGIVILIGLFLLAWTTGLLAIRSIWEWIPLLFVLLGVWALVRSEFRNLVGPVMIIAIAGAIFLRNVGVIPEGVLGTWWPLLIVLFGVLLVFSRSRRQQRARLEGHAASEATVVAIFGTDEQRIATDRFTGAELVAVFGDARLDLRDADVRTPPAIVETVSVFGDAEIRVPEGWDVRFETLNVFGDTTDRRGRSAADDRGAADRADGEDPELIVTGVSLFADVEIRD